MQPQYNSVPYFPSNLSDYAPWVATYGLIAPYGICQCGKCGQRVSVAGQSKTEKGYAKGHPVRFIPYHTGGPHIRSAEERFWEKVDKQGPDDCWEWQAGTRRYVYGEFAIGNKRDRSWRGIAAHRFSYELHYGPIPDGMSICHKCDNPACVNPTHLFLGTHGDNMRDRNDKGRQAKGSAHGRSKLAEEDILQIFQMRSDGMTQKAIAQAFGVSRSLIRFILSGERWKHICEG